MSTVVQIFARPPVAGEVKTRLIPDLGAEATCTLYEKMLFRTIETVLKNYPKPQIQLWLTHLEADFLSIINNRYSIQVFEQKGNNLGDKMHNAICQGLRDYQKVLLTGTDCPMLRKEHYVKLERTLADHEITFIPAQDGGYVALGCTSVQPAWFSGIDWGTDTVMHSTVDKLKGTKYMLLEPKLRDLDTIEDYRWYQENHPF